MTYHASETGNADKVHTHTETNTIIDSKDLGEVQPGADEKIEHLLEVPELPPSLNDKEAITIRYKFVVEPIPDAITFGSSGAEAKVIISYFFSYSYSSPRTSTLSLKISGDNREPTSQDRLFHF